MQVDTSHRSPNHSARIRGGKPVPISMLVIHATAGSASSALSWLCSAATRVSAHYLIDKPGNIYQLVSEELAAWHAGQARWGKQTAINEISIGIELENLNTGRDPYPAAQLTALDILSRAIVDGYHIRPENVVRHLDVAIPRGRKNDPAGFPWEQYKARLFPDVAAPPDLQPAEPVTQLYRVKARVTAGARVRTAANLQASVAYTLAPLAAVKGFIVPGALVELPGFGKGTNWVCIGVDRYIWAGLLELV